MTNIILLVVILLNSIKEKAFGEFVRTGIVGISPEERAQQMNEVQRIAAQQARQLFYTTLPPSTKVR